MKINDKFLPLANSDCRYFIITGGRGSSKSFSVNVFATLLTYEVGHKILFSRYTMSSAHDSIIPEFEEKIQLFEQEEIFYVTNKDVVNRKTDSKILFRGIKTSSGDQTANLKSLQGVNTWIIDEAEEFVDEEKFDDINLSIRDKTKQNRIIIILNPAYKSHWIYKRFFKDAMVEAGFNGEKNNVCYIHTTYKDNIENLNKSFIYEAEKTKQENPEKYNHVFLGKWKNNKTGIIYTRWRLGQWPEDKDFFTIHGLDWGFTDPFSLVEVMIDESSKQVFVRQKVYKTELVTWRKEVSNTVTKGDMIICDSALPGNIHELRTDNHEALPAWKGKGSIIKGITWLQGYSIVVCNSPDIEHELNNYEWADKKQNTPIDKYNHACDCIRYAVAWYKMNVRRE